MLILFTIKKNYNLTFNIKNDIKKENLCTYKINPEIKVKTSSFRWKIKRAIRIYGKELLKKKRIGFNILI
jgi:hypothetical protein